jgi:Haemolysin-III related
MPPHLIKSSDLPYWYEPSQFVITGYRNPIHYTTLASAVESAFIWHNETLNIHTHLFTGFAALFALYYRVKQPYYLTATPFVQWFNILQCLGAATMGFASAFAHTVYIIDPVWYSFAWKVDCVGIVAVVYTHILADHYLLFSRFTHTPILFYTSLATCTAAGALCIYKVFKSNGTNVATWGLYYAALGSIPYTSAVAWVSTSQDALFQKIARGSIICSICCLIAGVIFFTGKFPERFIQGSWIDYGFHSHVWHHIFISLSIYLGSQGIPYMH